MQKVLQDTIINLQLAGYRPRTVEAYSYHVKKFLEYYDKDPKTITEDEIKSYFLYLKNTKKLSGSAPMNRDFRYRSNNRSSHIRNKIYVLENFGYGFQSFRYREKSAR